MKTSNKALSIACAATLAGGLGLGTASVAAATVPVPSTQTNILAMKQAGQATITIDDFSYSVSGTITPGATVTVVNNDDVAHTATDADGAFDSGIIDPGASGTITAPQQPGEYGLICTIHPNMSGTLVVEAAQGGGMDDTEMGGGASGSDDATSEDDAAMNDGAMDDGAMEQQVSPMPEGAVDTGVTGNSDAGNLGVIALGGGLVLAAAAGGVYTARRRSTGRH